MVSILHIIHANMYSVFAGDANCNVMIFNTTYLILVHTYIAC